MSVDDTAMIIARSMLDLQERLAVAEAELDRLRAAIENAARSTWVARDANEDLVGWLERALAVVKARAEQLADRQARIVADRAELAEAQRQFTMERCEDDQ